MTLPFEPPTSLLSFMAYLALFIGVMLAFEGVRAVLSRAENATEARNRRMRMMRRGVSTEEVLDLLRDPTLMEGGGFKGPIFALRRKLVQSGLPISIGVFLLTATSLAAAAFVVAFQYLEPLAASGAAVAAGLCLPLFVVIAVKQERSKKLTQQLPDALDLMARGLRVGHPIATTVASVAEDMPDPIGTEFGLIQDQVSYGDEITVAFKEFADRAGTEDARYLAVSVGIQHGTGGNLARVLEILSKVIRDRQVMVKKIKAVSSEGRLSALILTLLPFGIFLSVHMSIPTYYGDVQGDPMFKPFVIAILGLVILQGLILRWLVNFKF